jgi:translocon-associated protein subunit delta
MYGKIILLSLFVGLSVASSCTNPEVKTTFFSTTDATIVSQIAYVAEFSLKCAGAENIPLFAEVEGKLSPAVRTGDNKYQVSRYGHL